MLHYWRVKLSPKTIGNNAIIGTGSVVVKDIPSNVIVIVNPTNIFKTNSI